MLMMDKTTKLILAIIATCFFPGLGNLILGQRKLGIVVLCASLFLTVFYFIPIIPLLMHSAILLMITSVIAFVAFIIDLGLLVYSLIKIIDYSKTTK
jgi:hypothetical protein